MAIKEVIFNLYSNVVDILLTHHRPILPENDSTTHTMTLQSWREHATQRLVVDILIRSQEISILAERWEFQFSVDSSHAFNRIELFEHRFQTFLRTLRVFMHLLPLPQITHMTKEPSKSVVYFDVNVATAEAVGSRNFLRRPITYQFPNIAPKDSKHFVSACVTYMRGADLQRYFQSSGRAATRFCPHTISVDEEDVEDLDAVIDVHRSEQSCRDDDVPAISLSKSTSTSVSLYLNLSHDLPPFSELSGPSESSDEEGSLENWELVCDHESDANGTHLLSQGVSHPLLSQGVSHPYPYPYPYPDADTDAGTDTTIILLHSASAAINPAEEEDNRGDVTTDDQGKEFFFPPSPFDGHTATSLYLSQHQDQDQDGDVDLTAHPSSSSSASSSPSTTLGTRSEGEDDGDDVPFSHLNVGGCGDGGGNGPAGIEAGCTFFPFPFPFPPSHLKSFPPQPLRRKILS